MTISDRINKKFNSHGTTIEESLKNAKIEGGEAGYEKKVTTETLYEGTLSGGQYVSQNNLTQFTFACITIPTGDTVDISLNGETKTLYKTTIQGRAFYVYPKGSDMSTFEIMSAFADGSARVAMSGDHSADTIETKVTETTTEMVVTDDFKEAVNFAGGESLIISLINDSTSTALDKTWKEIYDAFREGNPCIVRSEVEYDEQHVVKSACSVIGISQKSLNSFEVYVSNGANTLTYSCSSESAYPVNN